MNKQKKSILESNVLYTLIAIVLGFVVGAIFLSIAGISPTSFFKSVSLCLGSFLKIHYLVCFVTHLGAIPFHNGFDLGHT